MKAKANNVQDMRRRVLRLENLRRHLMARSARVQRMYLKCKGDNARLQDFADEYRRIMASLAYKINNLKFELFGIHAR